MSGVETELNKFLGYYKQMTGKELSDADLTIFKAAFVVGWAACTQDMDANFRNHLQARQLECTEIASEFLKSGPLPENPQM